MGCYIVQKFFNWFTWTSRPKNIVVERLIDLLLVEVNGNKLRHKLDINNKFTTYFSIQYKIEKLNNKLEQWYTLEFVNFIAELNKAIKTVKGTALTKKDEFDWIDLFP